MVPYLKRSGTSFHSGQQQDTEQVTPERVVLTVLGPGSFRRACAQQLQQQLEAPLAPRHGQVGAGARPRQRVQQRLQEHPQHILRPLLLARVERQAQVKHFESREITLPL